MTRLFAFSLIAALALAGAWTTAPRAAEDNDLVVGRLGGVDLTAAEARRLLSFMSADARKQLAESPGELEKVVRTELVRRALLAEARDKGVDRKPEIQYLMERGREQALISAYVQSLARPPAGFPSDQEIKSAYEGNQQALMLPVQYKLARIHLQLPSGSDKEKADAVGKRAADLAARLQKSPEEFAKVAREHSDDKATAAKGGEMGWVREPQITQEIRQELAKLDKGGVTRAVRTRQGWNIVQILDKSAARLRTLEEARPLLSAVLRQRWLQAQEKVYVENLLKKSTLQIDDAEMERLQESLQK